MNAVIYARYSSDNQCEESIEGQPRECWEYAERNEMTVVGDYIGRALSAKIADRPELQYMIKDSAKGLFKIDKFVNAVYAFDDKLVLTYNYQHGTEAISLDEIESALSSDFDGATPPESDRIAACDSFFFIWEEQMERGIWIANKKREVKAFFTYEEAKARRARMKAGDDSTDGSGLILGSAILFCIDTHRYS